MARTLILGAGFGGLTVATELRPRLGDDHEIVLVDQQERFTMGLRKLWSLVGLGSLDEGSRRRELLNDRGVRFPRRRIIRIDPAARRVETDQATWTATISSWRSGHGHGPTRAACRSRGDLDTPRG